MRTIGIAGHLSTKKLRLRVRRSTSIPQMKRWQVLYLASLRPVLPASTIADAVGVTVGTVYQWLHRYRNGGPGAMVLKRRR